jgi:hypothetical protein
MAERGFEVHHSRVHRCVIMLVASFEKAFRKHKRPVGKYWRMRDLYQDARYGIHPFTVEHFFAPIDKVFLTISIFLPNHTYRDRTHIGASAAGKSTRIMN